MMHWMWWNGGGWLMMILLWVTVIVGAYLVAKAITSQKGETTARETALEVLNRRYAHGDISREEFKSKESDIIAQSERSRKP
jgi:putative membrane protein